MRQTEMDEAATRYYPRVQKIARGIARHLPSYIDADDLVQAGVVGMMSALKAFDPLRCDRLDLYVERRIRGSILDELRALDPLSRDQRKDARTIDAATRELQSELGRSPEEEEVAERAGVDVERIREVRVRVNAIAPDSLNEENAAFLDGCNPDPIEMITMTEARNRLIASLSSLGERELQILSLYYKEDLSFKEIGEVFGVTESRVCQLHSTLVKKLRIQMQDA